MKSIGFGFEAIVDDTLRTKQQYITFNSPVIVTGIQMSVGFCITGTSQWLENTHTQVLALAHLPPRASAEIGPVTSDDHPGPLPVDSGCIAALILKSWLTTPPQSGQFSGNVSNMGLNIPVGAGEKLTLRMDHDGEKGSMEMQGVLFYELP